MTCRLLACWSVACGRGRAGSGCPRSRTRGRRGARGGVVPGGGDPGRGVHPLQIADLSALDQRDDLAGGASTRCAAAAVQVVFVVFRRVELHDEVDVVDVDAAGGDVGGHEYPRVSGRERIEGALAQGCQYVGDLLGELTGGHQDEGAGRLLLPRWRAGSQPGQQRGGRRPGFYRSRSRPGRGRQDPSGRQALARDWMANGCRMSWAAGAVTRRGYRRARRSWPRVARGTAAAAARLQRGTRIAPRFLAAMGWRASTPGAMWHA
jgi:hypothetical protein